MYNHVGSNGPKLVFGLVLWGFEPLGPWNGKPPSVENRRSPNHHLLVAPFLKVPLDETKTILGRPQKRRTFLRGKLGLWSE